MKTRPFNIEEAKAGAKVTTRDGRDVRIFDYSRRSPDYPIVGVVIEPNQDHDDYMSWTDTGKVSMWSLEANPADLVIIVEPKYRPWIWNECPVGACFRFAGEAVENASVILSRDRTGFVLFHIQFSQHSFITYDDAFQNKGLFSVDHGANWKECKIEIQ